MTEKTLAENITVTITMPSNREAVVTRDFDAPAALVFDAVTRADLIKRWHPGAADFCESDARQGGSFRFGFSAGGQQIVTFGVYQEFDPPRRFVRTQRYEGGDAAETIMTVELVERNGKTTMTQHFLYPTQEARDAVMKTGLTPKGMSGFYERLDALLASL